MVISSLESLELQEKLRQIKLLCLDVDGILTDGRLFWVQPQGWTRFFHTHDGHGLKMLMQNGIEIAVISAGDSMDVRARLEFLKIKHIFLACEAKLKALEKIMDSTQFKLNQIA